MEFLFFEQQSVICAECPLPFGNLQQTVFVRGKIARWEVYRLKVPRTRNRCIKRGRPEQQSVLFKTLKHVALPQSL